MSGAHKRSAGDGGITLLFHAERQWPAAPDCGRSAAMKQFQVIGLAALFLVGCAAHRTSSVAVVTRDAPNRYEIRLDKVEWSMGGPCNFPQFPHRIYSSHWIYTPTIEGEVSTNRLTLTYERGKTQYPWPQQALRGTIGFTNGHMQVDLQIPYYADGTNISKYVPYQLNGDYKLEMK